MKTISTRAVPYARAVALCGESALLSGVSAQKKWNWKRDGVPAAVVLTRLLGGPLSHGDVPPNAEPSAWLAGLRHDLTRASAALIAKREPWEYAEWQSRRRYTQAVESLAKLYREERYREIRGVALLLGVLVDWQDGDWRRVYEARIDHVTREAREILRAERAEG